MIDAARQYRFNLEPDSGLWKAKIFLTLGLFQHGLLKHQDEAFNIVQQNRKTELL